MSVENNLSVPLSNDYVYFAGISEKIRQWAASYGYVELRLEEFSKISKFKKVWDGFILNNKDFISFDLKKEKVVIRPDANLALLSQYIDFGKIITDSSTFKFYFIDRIYSFNNSEKSKTDDYSYNFGFSSVGSIDYVADVEIIKMAYYLLKELGIDCNVKINMIGCTECSKKYKTLLTNFLKTKKSVLCNECVKNMVKNPFAVLSCENKTCKKTISQAPLIVDNLCEDCKDYSMKVIEYLDELDIAYVLDPTAVDKDGVYNSFYFEFEVVRNNNSIIVGKGGRLDEYASNLGFKKTVSSVLFNFDQVIKRLKEFNKVVTLNSPDIFLAQLGETARKKGLKTFIELKSYGVSCFCNALEKSIVKQIALAKSMNAKLILILGQQEVSDNTVIIRDTETNVQEVVNYDNLIDEVKKRLIAKYK